MMLIFYRQPLIRRVIGTKNRSQRRRRLERLRKRTIHLETIKEEDEDVWGDEDDDELPPFDDWYQQIAQRNGVQVR